MEDAKEGSMKGARPQKAMQEGDREHKEGGRGLASTKGPRSSCQRRKGHLVGERSPREVAGRGEGRRGRSREGMGLCRGLVGRGRGDPPLCSLSLGHKEGVLSYE